METGRSVRSPPRDASIPDAPPWPVAMTPILPLLMKHPRSDEVFIDTSAFYAILDADDEGHAQWTVTSFAVMRHRSTVTAFAFDQHFAEQGFQLVS